MENLIISIYLEKNLKSQTGWLKCLNQEAPQISQKAPKKALVTIT